MAWHLRGVSTCTHGRCTVGAFLHVCTCTPVLPCALTCTYCWISCHGILRGRMNVCRCAHGTACAFCFAICFASEPLSICRYGRSSWLFGAVPCHLCMSQSPPISADLRAHLLLILYTFATCSLALLPSCPLLSCSLTSCSPAILPSWPPCFLPSRPLTS